MLLSEDDIELYAFEALARVLPDSSILPINTRENQLVILSGAIRYIRELESALEDTENHVTERSLTRLDTAAGPLLGFGEDPEPKRPKNGFIRFSIKNRRQVSLDHPGVDNREISRILGCKWKQLTQKEKKPYEEEFMVEMNKRRKMDPNWRYCGMRRRLLEDLVEPMPSRLRPRDQLRSKIEVSKLKRSYKKRQLMPQMFKWVQCDHCQKWRRLPSDTDMDLLPTQWYCNYNLDPQHNQCNDPEEPYTVPVPEVYPRAHAVTIYGPTRRNPGPASTQARTATSNGQMWNQRPCSSMKPTAGGFLPGAQAAADECFSSFSRFRWQHEGLKSCVGIFGSLPGVDDEDMMHSPGVGLHFK
ncbi:uncharacterized protein LOC135497762 [Lineus longissimus]|uniref:uncharacterized protein LOC135497762 n=1 Tax=Lineus longissimus TaxID=88925 RepID=UPI002B4CE220